MASGRQPPAEIDKTAARRFPLVHQLIHFADLRNFYREMREALISANRRAGAQQGLVTKARNGDPAGWHQHMSGNILLVLTPLRQALERIDRKARPLLTTPAELSRRPCQPVDRGPSAHLWTTARDP